MLLNKFINTKGSNIAALVSVITSALLLISFVIPSLIGAAPLQRSLVRFDRMRTSTATTGTVCAQAATVGVEASVQVAFPAGYTVSSTVGNWTVNTTNTAWPATAIAWPGIGTATASAAQVVTFPSGDLIVGTLYCFNWANSLALTTSASATNNNSGTITTRTSVPATIDDANFSTATVTDEQIIVTATVPQTFSFSLSANSDSLGSLSTGFVGTSPTPRVATINTNAKNGWLAWSRSANAGLNSASASATINSTTPGTNSTITAGSEGYNFGVTSSQVSGSGTITIPAAFVGTLAAQGGGLDTALRSIATSNGTAGTATLTLRNNASISATTASATDYTDTITVIAAGMF